MVYMFCPILLGGWERTSCLVWNCSFSVLDPASISAIFLCSTDAQTFVAILQHYVVAMNAAQRHKVSHARKNEFRYQSGRPEADYLGGAWGPETTRRSGLPPLRESFMEAGFRREFGGLLPRNSIFI